MKDRQTTRRGFIKGLYNDLLNRNPNGTEIQSWIDRLDFNDDDDEGFIGGLFPGHRGSMWTLGGTFYF